MIMVRVKLEKMDAHWTKACQHAVTDLNLQFNRKGVHVKLALKGAGPVISVRTDPSISGLMVHGKTHAEFATSGRLQKAETRLPDKVQINTPGGLRTAGPGVLEVIAAHEYVHALGQEHHSSLLMTRTFNKVPGNSAAGDKLQAGSAMLPPLALADDTVELLKGIWG